MEQKLIAYTDTNSTASELFKTLRTNVQFSLKSNQNIIMVTSAAASDGKSFVLSNLAATFTQIGKKVLIIDLDLRRRQQHKIFNVTNTSGMSVLLNNENFKDPSMLEDILMRFLKVTAVEGLFLIPAGPIPPNPSEILMNGNLKTLLEFLKDKFDYIFIDVPPVNVVTDTSIIARNVDATILVASVGKTKIRIVKEAQSTLKKSKANIIGVVANRVPIHKRSYKYKGYEYEYSSKTLPVKNNRKRK